MDLLLHPAASDDRPDPRGRLSTIGHAEALRAFARAAKQSGMGFMVIGGTYRDVRIRAASTRDIDVVIIDRADVDAAAMREAGFDRHPKSRYAWRYTARGDRHVDLQIAALASSQDSSGPFSVAFRHAERETIEGLKVSVPAVEDYVILKLLAALDDPRRRNRDLADIQHTLERYGDRARASLSIAALRARLRDLYRISGARLRDAVALLRQVPRPSAT